MTRIEFSKVVYAQIVHRATGPDGQVACEGCGLVLGRKPYHVDHTIPDGLRDKNVKRPALTADDGKLLGKDCCHAPKTAQQDVPQIAKAVRQQVAHNGYRAQRKPGPSMQSRPFAKADRPKRLPLPTTPNRSPLYRAAMENHDG